MELPSQLVLTIAQSVTHVFLCMIIIVPGSIIVLELLITGISSLWVFSCLLDGFIYSFRFMQLGKIVHFTNSTRLWSPSLFYWTRFLSFSWPNSTYGILKWPYPGGQLWSILNCINREMTTKKTTNNNVFWWCLLIRKKTMINQKMKMMTSIVYHGELILIWTSLRLFEEPMKKTSFNENKL